MNTDTLARFAQRAADQLVALHARLESGRITRAEFVALAVAFLTTVRARGVALADLALSTELAALYGRMETPDGQDEPEDVPAAVVDEALDSEQYASNAAAAVAVLARAQALDAVQSAYAAGMRRRDVRLWKRIPNTGACEVCEDLSDGLVSVDEVMWTHKGCGCSQQPVA